jgi:hypothetical protein
MFESHADAPCRGWATGWPGEADPAAPAPAVSGQALGCAFWYTCLSRSTLVWV